MALHSVFSAGIRCHQKTAWVPLNHYRKLGTVHSVRYLSVRTPSHPDNGDVNKDKVGQLLYEGSLTAPIKSLKRVSITTCALSLVGMPTLLFLGNNNMPLTGQVAVAGTAMAAAVGSTILLNACVRPYVHALSEIFPIDGVNKGVTKGEESGENVGEGGEEGTKRDGADTSRRFRAEGLDLLSRPVVSEFQLDEVEPQPNAMRPFVSFQAKGNYYYIQGESFKDKGLLRQLLGRPLKESEK